MVLPTCVMHRVGKSELFYRILSTTFQTQNNIRQTGCFVISFVRIFRVLLSRQSQALREEVAESCGSFSGEDGRAAEGLSFGMLGIYFL
jgi:hypothetical protein